MQRPERPERSEPILRPLQNEPESETPPSPFMPAKDAALLLHVSPDHVIRAIRTEAIPGFKWGDTYRVRRAFVEDLCALIDSGKSVVVEEFAKTWRAAAEAVA